MSFWFLVSIKCYHRPPGAVELSSPSSGPVSRFVDQCRFNAGVANAPRRRRWPFRKPAGLLEPSGSLLSKEEEHETRKKEVSCCFRAASTIFRKLDQMRQKNERGCFWPTDNTSMEKTGLYLLLLIGAANSLSDIVTLRKENEVLCITQDVKLATFISPPLIENSTKSLSLLTGEDWSYDNWILAEGSNSLSGPVRDKRWEDFEIVTTNAKTFISENSVSFSLYSPVEVHLFVTKSQEPDFTYSKELKKGWNHISIYLTNNDVYYLLNNKAITSMNALNPQQITVNTENDIFWKIHDYQFMMSEKVTNGKHTTVTIVHNEKSCLLLYISLCRKCVLTIPELNRMYNSTNDPSYFNSWQVHQLEIEAGIENLSFYKTTTDNSTLGYWGIDLHECPANNIDVHKENTPEIQEKNYICHVLDLEYELKRQIELCEDRSWKCIWGYTDSSRNKLSISAAIISTISLGGTLIVVAAVLILIFRKYPTNTDTSITGAELEELQPPNHPLEMEQRQRINRCV
ncbi:uncharacterized protein [Tenebrio molitor]|uniref:uncharacterized protein isoform X4 n=1 Tax=Tenebrio molitor TaxID=7067 RepID=UPI00362489D1